MAASKVAHRLRETWRKNWPEVHAALTGGFPDFVLSRSPAADSTRIPAFCYHLVSSEALEADLRYLAENGYRTLDADQYLEALDDSRGVSRAVLLTFDDGPRNLFETVFPLLTRYGMQAVAFICPGLHREELRYPTSAGRAAPGAPCSWEQIETMHTSGTIDFQSHTLEHRYVPRWPEPAPLSGCDPDLVHRLRGDALPLAEDLERSRSMLEDRLGKRVRHLAFPKFLGTEASVEVGTACGYEAFWWGALPGSRTKPGNLHPTHLPRLNDEWLWRLPGEGRRKLSDVVADRASNSWARILSKKNIQEPSAAPRDGQGGGNL
ncbi:MAG: polysaccharide deacetylase family protein [Gemmatimonadota bacterium]|nr:polysaccharide deacetylase family protein [Gemmatimonadota bacterium]